MITHSHRKGMNWAVGVILPQPGLTSDSDFERVYIDAGLSSLRASIIAVTGAVCSRKVDGEDYAAEAKILRCFTPFAPILVQILISS